MFLLRIYGALLNIDYRCDTSLDKLKNPPKLGIRWISTEDQEMFQQVEVDYRTVKTTLPVGSPAKQYSGL